MDSGPNFWLKLRVLGAEIVQIETQLIFLTAILLLQDEEDFFRAICILPECIQMFRSPTTCQNIQYQVQKVVEEILKAVCRLANQKIKQYPAPSKIIIYRGSVAQTKEIREVLKYLIYYCNINNQAGKARCIKELINRKF